MSEHNFVISLHGLNLGFTIDVYASQKTNPMKLESFIDDFEYDDLSIKETIIRLFDQVEHNHITLTRAYTEDEESTIHSECTAFTDSLEGDSIDEDDLYTVFETITDKIELHIIADVMSTLKAKINLQ